MSNHAELVVAFFATMRLGGIWAGINRQLAAPEKEYLLRDVSAKVFIGDARNLEQVGKIAHNLPDLERLIDAEPGTSDNEWNALLAEVGPCERALSARRPLGAGGGVVHQRYHWLPEGCRPQPAQHDRGELADPD